MMRREGSTLGPSTKAALLASTSTYAILLHGSGSTSTFLMLPSPLESILNDMWRAFDAGLYYPALLVALTLPEVCSALSMSKEEFVKEKHYSAFIDTYAKAFHLGLDGRECYRLRGGIIHRANASGHPHFAASHVIFTVPESSVSMHALSLVVDEAAAAMLDMKSFLSGMDSAVRKWFLDFSTDELVQGNIRSLLSLRPNGVSPFLAGFPVVASGIG